jgi:hypothetical protein
MAKQNGGWASLANHRAENQLGRPIGMLNGMMNSGFMEGIAGALGVDPNSAGFSKIFKMYPYLKSLSNTNNPGGGGAPGGGGGGTGGGPGTGGGTPWQYPGLLDAPYTTTNWFGK